MKIVTWNVNSVRARLDRLLSWLQSAAPDVVCLQEIKCVDDQFPLLEVNAAGYQAAVFGQKTYNGVAILARQAPTQVLRGLADEPEDDARVLAATVGGVRIVNVYAPNGQSVDSPAYAYKLRWYERLRRYLDHHHRPSEPLVVCGDFNVAPEPIDTYDPKLWEGQTLFTLPEREAFGQLLAFGLCDTFRQLHPEPGRYTWWDYRGGNFHKNLGLRIDHLLATAPVVERLAEVEVEREMRKGPQPSDHAPLWLLLRD